jgi:hypothetical protein
MTSILYDDDDPGRVFHPSIALRMDPTRQYLKHYDNLMYLTWIRTYSDRPLERYRANKEISVCERKLKYWSERAGYDAVLSLRGVDQIKRRWTSGKGKP